MDRRTKFGKRSSKGDNIKEDIQFHEKEPYCDRKQAQIEHRYNGYYLVERALNGYTRVMIKPDRHLQLYRGCTLSFGRYDKMAVLDVEVEEEARIQEIEQDEKSEFETTCFEVNLTTGNESLSTVVKNRRNKLQIIWLEGELIGKVMEFSTYDNPIKIGRTGGKDNFL